MSPARLGRWTVRILMLPIVALAAFVGWNLATENFATVRTGHVYRAGQMTSESLARVLRDKEIKTVLNLRGSHPDQLWYRTERKATLAAGATQIDMAMSSCEWMSRAQLRTLLNVLDTCDYPLLIHCWRGSERTGLVSAITELLRPGSALGDGEAQFSIRYLFVRAGDGRVTVEHLDQYESWLRKQKLTHSPEQLRRWMTEGFRPSAPSREDWPYDPYPLVVITRPEPNPDRLADQRPAVRK